jgi:hypothetical protein
VDYGPASGNVRAAESKEYLTLLGESTPTFEKSAYIIGIVGSSGCLYIRHHNMERGLAPIGFAHSSAFLPRRIDVAQMEWEWPMADCQENHSERVALLRPIPFEMTTPVDGVSGAASIGKALSLNISNGGMLLLMDQAPDVEQVLKIYVPTPITVAETPTLAEVRWTRKLPFGKSNGNGAYFVGLKFMF